MRHSTTVSGVPDRSRHRLLLVPTIRTAEVPVQLEQSHVYVPVGVGKHAPLWFLLDTGAQIWAFAQTTVDALHLVSDEIGRVRGGRRSWRRVCFMTSTSTSAGTRSTSAKRDEGSQMRNSRSFAVD
jgi:hypothetical protein